MSYELGFTLLMVISLIAGIKYRPQFHYHPTEIIESIKIIERHLPAIDLRDEQVISENECRYCPQSLIYENAHRRAITRLIDMAYKSGAIVFEEKNHWQDYSIRPGQKIITTRLRIIPHDEHFTRNFNA